MGVCVCERVRSPGGSDRVLRSGCPSRRRFRTRPAPAEQDASPISVASATAAHLHHRGIAIVRQHVQRRESDRRPWPTRVRADDVRGSPRRATPPSFRLSVRPWPRAAADDVERDGLSLVVAALAPVLDGLADEGDPLVAASGQRGGDRQAQSSARPARPRRDGRDGERSLAEATASRARSSATASLQAAEAAWANVTSSPARSAWRAIRAGSVPGCSRKRFHGTPVQPAAPPGSDLVLDRSPRASSWRNTKSTVVGEQHPGGEHSSTSFRRRLTKVVEQPRLGPSGTMATASSTSRAGADRRDARARRRDGRSSTPTVWCGECLGDVERIARGEGVHGVGVGASRRGEDADRLDRQPPDADPDRPLAVARLPRARRSGCPASTSSSRYVTTSRSGRSTARRPSMATSRRWRRRPSGRPRRPAVRVDRA